MDIFANYSTVKSLLEVYFRVEDLQSILKSFSLPINGRKSELLERVLSLINFRQYEPEFITKVKQKIKQVYQLRVAKTNVRLNRIDHILSRDMFPTPEKKRSKIKSSTNENSTRFQGSQCYEYDKDYSGTSDSSSDNDSDSSAHTSTPSSSSDSDDSEWKKKKKLTDDSVSNRKTTSNKNVTRKEVPRRQSIPSSKLAAKNIKCSRKRVRRISSSPDNSNSEDSNKKSNQSSDDSIIRKRKSKKTTVSRIYLSSSSSSSSSDEEMDYQIVDNNKNVKNRVENENNKNLCNDRANEKTDNNNVVMDIADDSDDDIQIIDEVVNKPAANTVVSEQQQPQSQLQSLLLQHRLSTDSITSNSTANFGDYENITTPNITFTPSPDNTNEKTAEKSLNTPHLSPISNSSLSNQNNIEIQSSNPCETNGNLENKGGNASKIDINLKSGSDDALKDIKVKDLKDEKKVKPVIVSSNFVIPAKKEELIPKQLPYEGIPEWNLPQIIIISIPKVDVKPDMPSLPACVSLRLIDPHSTLSQIKQRIFGTDSEIEALDQNLRLSLICPITNKRISTPGRSSGCQHVDCFDVIPFIQLNSKKKIETWRCPKCKQSAPLNHLIIDGLLKHILITTDDTCEAVIFDQNVVWRPEIKKHDNDITNEKLSDSVVDLIDLDDDDDDKQEQKSSKKCEPTMAIEVAKQLATTLQKMVTNQHSNANATNSVQLNYNSQTNQVHFSRQQPQQQVSAVLQKQTTTQPSVQQRPVQQWHQQLQQQPQQQSQRPIPQQSTQRTVQQPLIPQQSTQRTVQQPLLTQPQRQQTGGPVIKDYRELLNSVLAARPKPRDEWSNSNQSSSAAGTTVKNVNISSGSGESSSRNVSNVNNARRPILAPDVIKNAAAGIPKRYLMDHIAILVNDLVTKNGDVLRKAGQLYCELCCVPLGTYREDQPKNNNVECHVKGKNHQTQLNTLSKNNKNNKTSNSNQTNANSSNVSSNHVTLSTRNCANSANVVTNNRPQTQPIAPNAAVFQTQNTYIIPRPMQNQQQMPFANYNNFNAGSYGQPFQTYIPQQNKSQYNSVPPPIPPPAHQRPTPNNFQSSNNYTDFYFFPDVSQQFNNYYPNYNSNQYRYDRQT